MTRLNKLQKKSNEKAAVLTSCKLTNFERKQIEKSFERINSNISELEDLLRDLILDSLYNKQEWQNEKQNISKTSKTFYITIM